MSNSILKSTAKLGVFSIIMITVTSVDSIRNVPGIALLGSHLISYFIIAALAYFIPTALVCAELSTTYPQQGGVYNWGKKTLGRNFGLATLWYQYSENIVYYPPLILFIVATGTYVINPALTNDKMFMLVAINVIFWAITLLNIFGLKVSALFTNVLGTLGLVIPMSLMGIFGLYWVFFHANVSYVHLSSLKDILPTSHSSLADIGSSFTAIVLSLTGMEITTSYATEIHKPQKTYPKALFIATIVIILNLTFASVAVAAVIPSSSSSLNDGLVFAFKEFFTSLHAPFLLPILSIAIVLGVLATLNNWIIAPNKSFTIAAKDHFLPEVFAKQNKNKAPTSLLVAQGIVVSLLSTLFIVVPNVNSGMWLFNILMTQLYMTMYVLVFIIFVVSRYKHKNLTRPFKIIGGKPVMYLVAFLGIASSIGTILISFDIPLGMSQFKAILLLIAGFIILSSPFLMMIAYRAVKLRKVFPKEKHSIDFVRAKV